MSKKLTVKEVVGRLAEMGVQRSPRTIYRWANEGKVFKKIHRFGPAGILICEDEVERAFREEDLSV